MNTDELAKYLANKGRIGLNDALCDKLGIESEGVTRARLAAQSGDGGNHLQVLFLTCFVVDDTDFFGDGEIYWWPFRPSSTPTERSPAMRCTGCRPGWNRTSAAIRSG
jgi:hypothetical protein